ncbi:MAG: DUF1631 family protein [Pseudomonadales bacterium]
MYKTPAAPSARALARTIRRMAGEFLIPRLRSTLESAADELKGQSSMHALQGEEDQTLDTLREDLATLRELAARVPEGFCDALGDDIEASLVFGDHSGSDGAGGRGKRRQLRRNAGLEVALLADDELELSVMVSTVGARFERRNREALDAAVRAAESACDAERAEALRGLIGVFPLLNRFSTLLSAAPLSVASRSKVMGGFQFHVLDELERFYEPLAAALAPNGGTSSRSPGATTPCVPEAAAEPLQRPVGLQAWQQLLHGAPHGHHMGPSTGYSNGGAGSAGVPLATYLSQHPLTTLPLPLAPGQSAGVSLYDHVVCALASHGEVGADGLGGMDLDVLRLVSLFFETFLDNDSLAPALRFLVGRLQMPVLRVALDDPSFFDDDDHVARRLIQALCRIGIGWSSDMAWVERSPAYKEVSALIAEIVDHPAPDGALFEAVLASLEASQAARQEKVGRAEERVVQLETGRSRLKAVKLQVQDELNRCLARHRSLPVLRTFLADSWSKVLTFVCLRHGDSGAQWRRAIDLCDELARLLGPAASRAEAQVRFEQVPALLEQLEALMVDAGLTSAHIDDAIASLYREIDRIRESDDDWFASGGEMIIEREAALEPITLIPPPAIPDVEHGVGAETLEQIQPGTWVRVRERTGSGEFHQVKVAARVAETREILLVDERGARWGIWQEAEFADAMADGRIALVDHDLIVQHTLDAMITALTAATANAELCSVTVG